MLVILHYGFLKGIVGSRNSQQHVAFLRILPNRKCIGFGPVGPARERKRRSILARCTSWNLLMRVDFCSVFGSGDPNVESSLPGLP